MKLVVGMGSLDDYTDYVQAGADEIFIGYVPQEWQLACGNFTPLNRREVCYYNVQIGSESELMILRDLVQAYGVPITIACNGLHFTEKHLPMIADTLHRLTSLGFSKIILSDPAVLYNLQRYEPELYAQLEIQLSGEFGEMNRYLMKDFAGQGIRRIIFHRKVTTIDMKNMIQAQELPMEYEAFFLNEMCHFHGAYCNSLHCDELAPMCRMPGHLGTIHDRFDGQAVLSSLRSNDSPEAITQREDSPVGATGCGLGALYRLRSAGVTHLKIVGRGGYSEDMIRDIAFAKRALTLAEKSQSEESYLSELHRLLPTSECSHRCYYRE